MTRTPEAETERLLLGEMVLSPAALTAACTSGLEPAMFSTPEHAALYSALLAMFQGRQPVDTATLYAHAPQVVADIGGIAALAQMVEDVLSPALAPEHIRLIQEAALKRQTIAHLQAALTGLRRGEDVSELLQQLAEGRIEQVEPDDYGGYIEAALNDDTAPPYPTGLRALDVRIGGLWRGTVTVLAADTSHGKSAVALQFADQVAVRGNRVCYISAEMHIRPLLYRLASRRYGVPHWDGFYGREGRLTGQAKRALRALQVGLRIYAGQRINVRTLPRVLSVIHREAREGAGLVVLDYLQELRGENRNKRARYEELADMARSIRETALRYDIAVLLVVMLGRGTDNTRSASGGPVMANIRESGDIERSADTILFCWRPDRGEEEDRTMLWRCSKSRNGRVFSKPVETRWHGEYQCVTDIDQPYEPLEVDTEEMIL